jgi:hypothetical protein
MPDPNGGASRLGERRADGQAQRQTKEQSKGKPGPGAGSDPILPVIAHHKSEHARWIELQDEANAALASSPEDQERKSAQAERQWHVVSDAARALFATTPNSIEGLLALLQYIAEREAAGDELLALEALPPPHSRASVALCHRAIEVLGPRQPASAPRPPASASRPVGSQTPRR